MNGQQFNDKFAEFHSIDATRNLLERDRGGGVPALMMLKCIKSGSEN